MKSVGMGVEVILPIGDSIDVIVATGIERDHGDVMLLGDVVWWW